MSSRVFKNYQVNMGVPFTVKSPLNYDNIKKVPDDGKGQAADASGTEPEDPGIILEKARDEARKEAAFIIEEARLEAARIIEEAENEAAKNSRIIENNAAERGYSEGMDKARRQYEDILQEAEFIREHARAEYNEVLESMEADMVELITGIARKVIGEEVRLNKQNILFMIRQAFAGCSSKDGITLRVASEDYDYVEENREKLQEMIEGVGEFEVKRDPSLKAASCILETSLGSVDASADTKLDRIEEEFKKAAGGQNGSR